MTNLQSRIERLESVHGRRQRRLVLIAPHGRLTAEQRGQVRAAETVGREVFVINLMPRAATCAENAARR